jgi:chitinase
LCTHLIYSFGKVVGSSIDAYEWNDKDTMYPRTMALKQKNPSLKILLAIGGWNHGSAPFTQMTSNPTSRSAFVASSVKYLKQYGFDGLDLDWEYPAYGSGSSPQDKQHLTALVTELKQAFTPHGLLLTAAVAAGKTNIDNGYEIDKISRHLDWINLMTYVFLMRKKNFV